MVTRTTGRFSTYGVSQSTIRRLRMTSARIEKGESRYVESRRKPCDSGWGYQSIGPESRRPRLPRRSRISDDTSSASAYPPMEASCMSSTTGRTGTAPSGRSLRHYSASWYPLSGSDEYTTGMSYELWSLTSRNLMHSFETEAEAVETARAYLEDGALQASELAIVNYGDDDVPMGSVSGSELDALVRSQTAEPGRRSA